MIGMVINKVAAKCIKGIREMKGIREKSSAIHRWKQGTMSNAVYMNHCKIWESVMAIANELRLNNPLASFVMHWFTNRYKPVNKRTVVVHTLINKWEEQVHPPHTHSQEAIMVQVSSHEDMSCCIPSLCHKGLYWMSSWYIPPAPQRLLGA